MNKTLKAWCMGFVRFDVNGRKFWRYNTAKNYANTITGAMAFVGYHVRSGQWRCFKARIAEWNAHTKEVVK